MVVTQPRGSVSWCNSAFWFQKEMEAYKELFQSTYMALLAQGLAPNEAVAQALQQLQQQVAAGAGSVAPNPCSEASPDDVTMQEEHGDDDQRMNTPDATPAAPTAAAVHVAQVAPVPLGLQLKHALEQAQRTSEYREAKSLVYRVFSDLDAINTAFVTKPVPNASDLLVDEAWWHVDREELANVYALLSSALQNSPEQDALQNTMQNAMDTLVNQPWNLCASWKTPGSLRFILVLFEHPLLFDPDYVHIVGGLCKLFFHTSPEAKDLIRTQWRDHFSHDELYRLLQILQQSITVCLYGSRRMDLVYAACSVLKEIHAINLECSEPFATYEEFYNDAVNSEVDIVQDYARSLIYLKKKRALNAATAEEEQAPIPPRMLSEMSFCDFPFVLDAASKSRVLQIDSDLEQRSRVQDAMMTRSLLTVTSPYLILKVNRDNLIEDSLQLLVRASPETLKKPLKVKFIGEEGIDEGGVQKEFFQILIRQLLDPAFGMFTEDEDTRTLWFNSDSLESTMEFELIGILLGVAIYNSVILDVHFPHIVYKKLMGCPLDLEDIELALPSLGNGLRQLLEFDGNVEDVFQRNFEYSYEIFGEVKTVELKSGGSGIPVTNANREEYVALYVEYIMNRSVSRQYDAFHRGFHQVCNGEVLQMFRWEELHLLICGSPELDFEALEEVTHYDDGFTEDSECIRYAIDLILARESSMCLLVVRQEFLECGPRAASGRQEEAANVHDRQRPSAHSRTFQPRLCDLSQWA